MKRSVFAGGWVVAGALLFAGCGGPAADVEVRVRTITAEDVDRIEPGRKLTIDTTDVRAGFVFDQREHAIDFERINLICPNGAMMPMDRWLDAQGAAQGVDLKSAIYNAVGQIETPAAATADPDTNEADDCEERCWLCEDGLVLCHYECELQSLRRMAENGGWMLDPRIVAGLQGPPGPTNPGGGDPGGGDGGGAPPTGDPNDGGRPGGEGSGGTDGGGGGSGGGSGGSSGTGGTPGGQGSAGGNQGGSSGTGGGRGFF